MWWITLGFTPLIAAANVDNTAVAKLLIEKGASLNAKTLAGQAGTALMGAASNGNLELTPPVVGAQCGSQCDLSRQTTAKSRMVP